MRIPTATGSASQVRRRGSKLLAVVKPDRQLVDDYLCDRSEDAFRDLYRRHSPSMYAFALRLTGGRHAEAEDAIQDAWVRALLRLQEFRWESALRTWLCGILINCVRERLRDRWLEPAEQAARVIAHPRANALDLEQLLYRLAPGYRAVLVLHDVEGYTHAEIAGLLGIDVGTAKSQLSRARNTMRGWLNHLSEDRDASRRR